MDEPRIVKYPRTRHLEGSGLQKGDLDDRAPLSALDVAGATVVYEEKADGANCGFRFDGGGRMLAQSRGHYLDLANRNAPRERDWSLLKDWLSIHADEFLERFEDRYVVYGEWMGIVHSCFYDRLPDYFLEFDIYDLRDGAFLDTTSRRDLCRGLPITSVPVLHSGAHEGPRHMLGLVRPSIFRTPDPVVAEWPVGEGGRWEEGLARACALVGDDYAKRIDKLDRSGLSEGLYVKVERDGRVLDRFKWVRPGFTQTIMSADEHWQSRFPVPNLLDGPSGCFPAHLARSAVARADAYDPDAPWDWGPWSADLAPAPGARR